MKKFFILTMVFVLALTACDAMTASTEAPAPEPTTVPPTAEVIVVTVEVPVEALAEPTEAPAEPTAIPPTPEPTATQPPAPTAAPPTEAAPAENTSSDGGSFTVPSNLWSPYFKDVTYSGEAFSLRCYPGDITISGTATDSAITRVDLFYRIEDRKGTTISEWKNVGRMQSSGDGIFSLTVSGESIHPDLRKELAWFDFQLVGLNKGGGVVGRTEKIVQQVTYTIDCP
jgi:hypothetical protein